MDRRKFIQTSALGFALSATGAYAQEPVEQKTRRVGLIGTGWYGKSALLRLIQVAPVEVVALCDVDRKMLEEAVEIVASRQKSGKKPKMYHDYREMLKQEQFDIVQVSTPDHWHALPMIEAVKAGADVYVEKPISVDVVEGQAMLAAARKYNRVVQVGTQRRSTPHLVEARDKIIREGKLGKIGLVEIYCYYHMRNRSKPTTIPVPEHFDYEFWAGPAPKIPYNPVVHPRGWRAFMEYGNGIVGDMCIHMYDMVRWMLDLGFPQRISSSGGIQINPDSISNISDTQTATFDHGDLRSSGSTAPGRLLTPNTRGATIYGDRGTLKAGVMGYDFIPGAMASRFIRMCSTKMNGRSILRMKTKGSGTARSPGTASPHAQFPARHRQSHQTRRGH